MVKEKLAAIGKPLRKFASTPNLAAAVSVFRSQVSQDVLVIILSDKWLITFCGGKLQ